MDAAAGGLRRCPGPVELPGLCHTNPGLLGAITQSEAETPGTHSSPAFPRLSGSLVILLPGFQKKCRRRRKGWGGNPHEFLENKRRNTKEEQRGREGGSRSETEAGSLLLAEEGAGESAERLDPRGLWVSDRKEQGGAGSSDPRTEKGSKSEQGRAEGRGHAHRPGRGQWEAMGPAGTPLHEVRPGPSSLLSSHLCTVT